MHDTWGWTTRAGTAQHIPEVNLPPLARMIGMLHAVTVSAADMEREGLRIEEGHDLAVATRAEGMCNFRTVSPICFLQSR